MMRTDKVAHKFFPRSVSVTIAVVFLVTKVFSQSDVINQIAANMVRVEGGAFTMGCTEEQTRFCYSDEVPPHKVTVRSFYINKYEVTQELWMAVMGNNPSYFKNRPRCPVEKVSYTDAQKFIARLNKLTGKKYRLPTEAEWEYAARGGIKSKSYLYSGANKIDDVGWCRGNCAEQTHPVGEKLPNELGLYDMSGNVWEWTNDYYRHKYYETGEAKNPLGPADSGYKVLRGGSWWPDSTHCRVSNRDWFGPFVRLFNFGLRLVLDDN
jgi:formylglycine-generating enzyme required for sulfatase activity